MAVEVSALMGFPAVARLLTDFVMSPNGATVRCEIAVPHEAVEALVLVRVNDGARVAMSVLQARDVARYCFNTALMPPAIRRHLADGLAEFARLLLQVAADAEAMAPGRLH
jgi:hypothetical protein